MTDAGGFPPISILRTFSRLVSSGPSFISTPAITAYTQFRSSAFGHSLRPAAVVRPLPRHCVGCAAPLKTVEDAIRLRPSDPQVRWR